MNSFISHTESTSHELHSASFPFVYCPYPSSSPSLIIHLSKIIFTNHHHSFPSQRASPMASLESWLSKMKSTISTKMKSPTSKSNVGILAFEIASLMSKLVHLWRFLSDSNVSKLRHETITLEGIRKIVSDDDGFLLGLACAELTETLRAVVESISGLGKRCSDQELRRFGQAFKRFVESGEDGNRWAMSWNEMETKAKKMDRYIVATAALYKEMDELSDAEHGLKKLMQQANHYLKASKFTNIADVQQKIFWQRQEIKYLRQSSLWGCTLDSVISLLARSSFTILARIKHVFGISHRETINPTLLPRSLSVSALVYPSSETPPQQNCISGPLNMNSWANTTKQNCDCNGFFKLSSLMIIPPETTLGAAALALHYANVVAVIEKMIKNPRAVGSDARDDLYAMLPSSVRKLLRDRLRGVGWGAARDGELVKEWRDALERIVEWMGPIAHNTIKWQGERSFERRSAAVARANVMVFETLYFANREKVEAAIAELLVGLNYVWRFEMEMRLVV